MKRLLLAVLVLSFAASAACARKPAAVRFSPDGGTPDFTDLKAALRRPRPGICIERNGQAHVVQERIVLTLKIVR